MTEGSDCDIDEQVMRAKLRLLDPWNPEARTQRCQRILPKSGLEESLLGDVVGWVLCVEFRDEGCLHFAFAHVDCVQVTSVKVVDRFQRLRAAQSPGSRDQLCFSPSCLDLRACCLRIAPVSQRTTFSLLQTRPKTVHLPICSCSCSITARVVKLLSLSAIH